MSSVDLPISPAPRSVDSRLVSAANTLSPAFGGDTLRLNRKGSKWSIAVQMPPMLPDVARVWIARMVRAEGSTVTLAVPNYGIETGTPGAPRVKGAGQAGSLLILDGMTPGYIVREGTWLSHINGTRRRLYMATDSVVVSASGEVTVPIGPILRFPPADNDVVEISQPKIEGYLETADVAWSMDVASIYGLSFSITER